MDEYNYDSYDDSGMEISRVSDDELAELHEIEGVEGSYSETADEAGDIAMPDFLDPNEKSTPDNPLYDAEGNKIPYGFTRKDWEIRKKAVAEKQKEIEKRKALEAERAKRQEAQEQSIEAPVPEETGAPDVAEPDIASEQDISESVPQEEMPIQPDDDALSAEASLDDVDINTNPANVPREETSMPVRDNDVPEEHGRTDGIGEDYIRDNFAGHGESSIVGEAELDAAPAEHMPDFWQEDFSYTINPDNKTITLNEYHGENGAVYIPPVAYDEKGQEYKVLLSEDKPVFSDVSETTVKVSNEILQENFDNFYAVQKEQYETEMAQRRIAEREKSLQEERMPEPLAREGGSEPSAYSNKELDTAPSSDVFAPEETFAENPSLETEADAAFVPENAMPEDSVRNASPEANIHAEAGINSSFGANESVPSEEGVTMETGEIPFSRTEESVSNAIPDNTPIDDPYSQNIEAVNRQAEMETIITQEAVERQTNASKQGSSDFSGTFVGSEHSVDQMFHEDLTGNGSSNIRQSENEADFAHETIGKVEKQLGNLDKGIELGEYGPIDGVKGINPKEQLLAASAGVSISGSVINEGTLPIDGDTVGSYGNPGTPLTGMLSNTEYIADRMNSNVGQNNTSVSLRNDYQPIVGSYEDARREMAENYVREAYKESDARKTPLNEYGELSRAKKEDLTEITSRKQEIKVKRNLIDLDNIQRSAFRSIQSSWQTARQTSGIYESDSGRTEQKAKQKKDDIEYVFGDQFTKALMKLEKYRGDAAARASNLLGQYIAQGKLTEKDFEVTNLKGVAGADRKRAVLKDRAKKGILDDKLKALGLDKADRAVILERSFRDTMHRSFVARREILSLSKANANIFTKTELDFVKSGEFFNAASNAGKIGDITHKFFRNSKNPALSSVSRKSLNSISAMKHLSLKAGTLPLSEAEKAVISFQNMVVARSFFSNKWQKYLEYNKHGKIETILHFLSRAENDAARSMNKMVSYVHTGRKYARIVGWVLKKAFGNTRLGKFLKKKAIEKQHAKEIKAAQRAASRAKLKTDAINKLDKAKNKLLTRVTGDKKLASKMAKKKAEKAAAKAAAKVAVSGKLKFIGAAVAKVSALVSEIAGFLATVGIYVLIAIGIIILLWFLLFGVYYLLMGASNFFLDLTDHAIMAEVDDVTYWSNNLIDLDEKRYDDALERAQEPPTGKAWDDTKLYHYGHYEYEDNHGNRRNYPTLTFDPRQKKKWDRPNYYNDADVELDTAHNQVSDNGVHIYYIDANGDTIGANTSNVKDVITLTAVLMDNWMAKEGVDPKNPYDKSTVNAFNKMLYDLLNPDPVYLESELYSCDGCSTYPKYGEYLNNKILNAYDCSDAGIYTKFNQLQSKGVKFFTSESFVTSAAADAKEYPEKLVPQTTDGCNITAKLDSTNVIEPLEYAHDLDGHKIWDEDEGHYVVEQKRILGVTYEHHCGTATNPGFTYNYERDYGSVFGDTSTTNGSTPYIKNSGRAYGKATSYLSSYQTDAEESWRRAGFDTHAIYERTTEKTPHAAIKCCYGHRDLNVYIPILTKDDLIAAKGGKIKYRVPKSFDAVTGDITEWEEKETLALNDVINANLSYKDLTNKFYEDGGFDDEYHLHHIESIYSEDWYELYGVNVYGDAAIPDSLTRVGKDALDTHTPAYKDISDARLNFVKEAYKYVGVIDYYYGGKASSTNFSSNKFGTIVRPDSMGRTKKGLDCSGFVHFVYCRTFGRDLNTVGSSTKSFCSSLGLAKITFKDIQPGDIGLVNVPGSTTNHIGIYAGDGMWIHCSGAPTNTVVYKNTNMFRYYYRLS